MKDMKHAFHFHRYTGDDNEKYVKIRKWLENNFHKDDWVLAWGPTGEGPLNARNLYLFFKNSEDAMAFKLKYN